MKRFFYLGLIMALFIGCSSEVDTDQNLFTTPLKGKKADLIVTPSGDATGATDANSIESALASLPSGGVLLLESGTFYINRTITAPDSFNGTILGRGVDKTQIIGVGDETTPFSIIQSLPEDIGSTFFLFQNPNQTVEMGDIWFNQPNDLYTNTAARLRGLLTTYVTVLLGSNSCNTNFKNLRLVGFLRPDPPGFIVDEATPLAGLSINGNLSVFPIPVSGGSHSVTKTEISKIGFFPTVFQGLKNADIVFKGNTVSESRQIPFQLLDGCDIEVKNNTINARDLGTLNFNQQGRVIPGNSNVVEVANNTITTKGLVNIEVGIAFAGADYRLTIKNNQLTNLGTNPTDLGERFPSYSVIGVSPGNEQIEVKNNTILGTSQYAIFQQSNQGSFKDNNLTNFTASQFDYFLSGDNNELKGVGDSTVDDQGSNNTVKN